MFGKKKQKSTGQKAPLLMVMGQVARLEGKFTIAESIQIECEVAGEIHVEGQLVIGQKGVVHADVHTSDAIIKGKYEGNMVATGNVEITASGHATGNIETDSLVISKGGFFNGNVVRMQGGTEAVADRRSIGPALVEQKHAEKKPA